MKSDRFNMRAHAHLFESFLKRSDINHDASITFGTQLKSVPICKEGTWTVEYGKDYFNIERVD